MIMVVLQVSKPGLDLPLGCGLQVEVKFDQGYGEQANFELVQAPQHRLLFASRTASRDREFGDCPIDPPP